VTVTCIERLPDTGRRSTSVCWVIGIAVHHRAAGRIDAIDPTPSRRNQTLARNPATVYDRTAVGNAGLIAGSPYCVKDSSLRA